MLKPNATTQVPADTIRVAKAAFPKGNVYLYVRDELGSIFQDEDFADLYPELGRPALPAWQLALVTIVQFKEGLSDRQAAEAVRARIDLKYLLGLDLTDPGFDYSVLSEFRGRLMPREHVVDSGYVRASYFIASQEKNIELVGPVRAPANWQARTEGAFEVSQFEIDWEKQQVTCPQGKTSSSWSPSKDAYGNKTVSVNFRHHDCIRCEVRSHCTRQATGRRQLVLRPREEHETIQQARVIQQTDAWQLKYNKRAGIEGTFSQGVRTQGLRRSRYQGLAKTRLQHSATASGTNFQRLHDFWCGITPAQTRISQFQRLAA
jgi:transposase